MSRLRLFALAVAAILAAPCAVAGGGSLDGHAMISRTPVWNWTHPLRPARLRSPTYALPVWEPTRSPFWFGARCPRAVRPTRRPLQAPNSYG